MNNVRIISESSERFSGRIEAGRLLGQKLKELGYAATVVLGIPRGGLVIAREIARVLRCRWDMIVVSKLGAPGNPELAVGAVAENGLTWINRHVAEYTGADESYISSEKRRCLEKIRQRVESFRSVRPRIPLKNESVIIIDDGLATGATMQSALGVCRKEETGDLLVAVPVSPFDSLCEIAKFADQAVCLRVPADFAAVGQFYENFTQVADSEVLQILSAEDDWLQTGKE